MDTGLSISNPSRKRYVNCPGCNTPTDTYGQKECVAFGCANCGIHFYYEDGELKQGRKFCYTNTAPAFKLGAIATIDGKEYQLVGYFLKSEFNSLQWWKEYIFYNPDDEWYVTLVCINNYWLLVKKYHGTIFMSETGTSAKIDGESDKIFDLKHSYQAVFEYAAGAFDWNFLEDESMHYWEFFRYPRLILCEKQGENDFWFLGEYVDPKNIINETYIDKQYYRKKWLFSPEKVYRNFKLIIQTLLVAIGLLLFNSILKMFVAPEKELLRIEETIIPDSTSWSGCKTIFTPTFHISHSTGLGLDFYSPKLDNDWIDISGTLINEKTGKRYEFEKSLEKYSGIEGGVLWQEGNLKTDASLSYVPEGDYKLIIYPSMENKTRTEPITLGIAARKNVAPSDNLWLTLFLVLIIPLIQTVRILIFENITIQNS